MSKKQNLLAIVLAICLIFTNTAEVFSASASSSTPPAPTIGASPTTPTNGNVTVTAYYPKAAVVKQYKLGSTGTWITYSAPFVVTANTYVYARYQNSTGYWSALGGLSISNIDKTPPVSPTFKASTIAPTNQNVTVTITYSSDSSAKQYRIGSSTTWVSYTAPVTLSSNNTIYAKASDSVGNWTPVVSYSVTNIDKTPPDMPIITASTTSPTNQSIDVTIDYSADSVIKQYKVGDSGSWTDYSGVLTVASNTTIYAKACDNAGNWSAEASYAVGNIDKTPPSSPIITANTASPTNQGTAVSIEFSNDSTTKQYKVGANGTWIDYSGTFTVTSNSTIYAKASDAAGNWTPEVVYEVVNIDTVPPADPSFSASTALPTNQDVVLTISYSDDSSTKQYKIGSSGSWTNYTGPVAVTANATVYAKASDIAGNWTNEVSYIVDCIDKTPPEKANFTPSTTALTDQPVTVTITFSQDSGTKQYKLGADGVWTSYTAPVAVSSNNTVYAKSSDNVGNWSLEASYQVTNIRKTVLGYTVKNSSTDVSSYNSIVANSAALNEIATATYTVDGLGNLAGAAPTDQINYANSNGIRAKLMISNNFDSAIAKQLLESPTNRQALKNNILNTLKTYNYKGVDIDIENVPAADRSYMTTLMSELYSALKPLGYAVSVAVPAKTSDSPANTWNYAFDFKSLADYSDYLMLMAYDEHYPGGTAGSIASVDWVTSVVDYALTVVPKDKIILGMAAYGYDWVGTTTKAYSINGCINLATQYGATINFDSTTKSKYFNYTVNGVAHSVWFEDADTIAYKLDLANTMDLKGVGIWRLGLENTNYWTMIKSKLNK